jgi:hypothetical protein
MFVGLERSDGLPDERFCFGTGQIELLTRVPSVPLRLRGSVPPDARPPLYPHPCRYLISPAMAHLLFKLYETISREGYGDHQISIQRRNNDIYLVVKAGRHYCYRIRPDELTEIKCVFNHLNMYILYKQYHLFEDLL